LRKDRLPERICPPPWRGAALDYIDRFGFLGPRLTLGHGVWLSEADLDRIAATGTHICHNCSSNLRQLSKALLPHVRRFYVGYFDPDTHAPDYRPSSRVRRVQPRAAHRRIRYIRRVTATDLIREVTRRRPRIL
jgi:hypothetical protein